MNQKHQCPVCGFGMDRPAADFNICPSCGTEFGYSDSCRDTAELRADWIEEGTQWHSTVVSKPEGWRPLVQLLVANLISLDDFALLTGIPIRIEAIGGATEQTSAPFDDYAVA